MALALLVLCLAHLAMAASPEADPDLLRAVRLEAHSDWLAGLSEDYGPFYDSACARGSAFACTWKSWQQGGTTDPARFVAALGRGCAEGERVACLARAWSTSGYEEGPLAGLPKDEEATHSAYRELCAQGWSVACLEATWVNQQAGEAGAKARLQQLCRDGDPLACAAFGVLVIQGQAELPPGASWETLLGPGCDSGQPASCMLLAQTTQGAAQQAAAHRGCAGGARLACAVEGVLLFQQEPPELEGARAAWLRGCERNEGWSCLNIGQHLVTDESESLAWFERSCAAGIGDGCAAAGDHPGSTAERKATLWQKACDLGNASGCVNHGGAIVDSDPVAARAELQIACDGGAGAGCTLLAAWGLSGRLALTPDEALDALKAGCAIEPNTCPEVSQFERLASRRAQLSVDCQNKLGSSCEALAWFDHFGPWRRDGGLDAARAACARGSAEACHLAGRALGEVGLLQSACAARHGPACFDQALLEGAAGHKQRAFDLLDALQADGSTQGREHARARVLYGTLGSHAQIDTRHGAHIDDEESRRLLGAISLMTCGGDMGAPGCRWLALSKSNGGEVVANMITALAKACKELDGGATCEMAADGGMLLPDFDALIDLRERACNGGSFDACAELCPAAFGQE